MTQKKIYVKTSKHKTKPIQIFHPSGRGESFQELTIAEARELIQDLKKASGFEEEVKRMDILEQFYTEIVSHIDPKGKPKTGILPETIIFILDERKEKADKLDAVTTIACQKNTRPRSAILRLGDLNRIRRILEGEK